MILNLGGHGLGDCILSLQISYFLFKKNIKHQNLISTRPEIFDVLKYLFKDDFDFEKADEEITENNLVINSNLIQQDLLKKYNASKIIFNVPDLLFKNPIAFDYKEYNLSPQIIKKQRLLLDSSFKQKKENIIYCGLATSTENYVYQNIPELIQKLGQALPDHKIYFPLLTNWDKPINNLGNFNINFPENVIVDKDPKFENSLRILQKSTYGIFTCNGPSHVAYHLGIPRLILDPQFGKLPWITRWKEDYEECISINASINEILAIVTNNILVPQTQMFDRKFIPLLQKEGQILSDIDWSNILYFKY
jgi:hypothetical protein